MRVCIFVRTRAYPGTLFGVIFGTFSNKDAPWDHFASQKVGFEGFQAHVFSDFCSDLGVPGTAKIRVSCSSVVKNHSFADSRIL